MQTQKSGPGLARYLQYQEEKYQEENAGKDCSHLRLSDDLQEVEADEMDNATDEEESEGSDQAIEEATNLIKHEHEQRNRRRAKGTRIRTGGFRGRSSPFRDRGSRALHAHFAVNSCLFRGDFAVNFRSFG